MIKFSKLINAMTNPKAAIANICQRYLDGYNGYSYDFFENGESDLIDNISRISPKVVFDVGANVGDWTSIASDLLPNTNFHCFELSKKTFKTLSGRLNRESIILNNVGLAEKDGTFTYKDYGENSGVNTILLDATYHDNRIKPTIIEANLTTGDIYCYNNGINKIDFLKIDVEGAEHLVLQGFSEMFSKKAIRSVQFEYGYTNGDSRFLMRDFYKFFKEKGYIVGRVRKGPITFREWIYRDNDFTSGPNYVAIRENDEEMVTLLTKKK